MVGSPGLVEVGNVDDFSHARPRIVQAGGRELGIIRWHDTFFAVRNVCPHMGARICLGTVTARTFADGPLSPVAADQDRPVVTCPWHGWTFEIGSGRSVADPFRFRVRSYAVIVVDGRVLVDVGRAAAPAQPS
jgi:3-phenylpropionate/trans-cinnamate dioxygenase ferredoxin subunit